MGAKIFVRVENIEQNFIHDFLSSNGVAKISVGGHSANIYSSKNFEKFQIYIYIYINLHKNLKSLQKCFKNLRKF